MYQCCMCSQTFEGDPVLQNAAGAFCPECKKELYNRVGAGRRNRHAVGRVNGNGDAICNWCGDPITKHNPIWPGTTNIHYKCGVHRAWLLKCIRHSDYAAIYVARTEAHERPKREARIEELKNNNGNHSPKAESNLPETRRLDPETETRLANVEQMLITLTKELGL